MLGQIVNIFRRNNLILLQNNENISNSRYNSSGTLRMSIRNITFTTCHSSLTCIKLIIIQNNYADPDVFFCKWFCGSFEMWHHLLNVMNKHRNMLFFGKMSNFIACGSWQCLQRRATNTLNTIVNLPLSFELWLLMKIFHIYAIYIWDFMYFKTLISNASVVSYLLSPVV